MGSQPTDDDPLLRVNEAAARAGVQPSTWRAYVNRQQAPRPDDPDEETPKERRQPRWRQSTVDAFNGRPRRPGRRTDLRDRRAAQRAERAAELASPPAAAADLAVWLETNHQRLLVVADVLVDHREDLLAGAPASVADQLAQAIDLAGEYMTARPSLSLARGVAYALFWLRPDGPFQAPADSEVAGLLAANQRLREELNRLRPLEL